MLYKASLLKYDFANQTGREEPAGGGHGEAKVSGECWEVEKAF